MRVGDTLCLASPPGSGPVTARVQTFSLGSPVPPDATQQAVIVPNRIMMNTTLLRVARAGAGNPPPPG